MRTAAAAPAATTATGGASDRHAGLRASTPVATIPNHPSTGTPSSDAICKNDTPLPRSTATSAATYCATPRHHQIGHAKPLTDAPIRYQMAAAIVPPRMTLG